MIVKEKSNGQLILFKSYININKLTTYLGIQAIISFFPNRDVIVRIFILILLMMSY